MKDDFEYGVRFEKSESQDDTLVVVGIASTDIIDYNQKVYIV